MRLKFTLHPYYTKPSILSSTPVVILIIILLYGIFKENSFLFIVSLGNISPVFPAAGFCLALVLLYGQKALTQVFLGSFIASIIPIYPFVNIADKHFILSVGLNFVGAVGFTTATAVSAFVVSKFCKNNHPLYSGNNVLYLLIFGTLSFSIISSLVGLIYIPHETQVDRATLFYNFITWFLGDAIGIIIFAPFVLVWYFNDFQQKNKFKTLEFITTILSIIIVFIVIYFEKSELAYLLIPLLLWSAYRFGMRYTAFIIVLFSMSSILIESYGFGPFVKDNVKDSILFLDLFLSVITICSLFFAGLLAEQNRAEYIITISEKNLRKNQDVLQSTIESPKDISIYSIDKKYEYISFNKLHSLNMKQSNHVQISKGMNIMQCIIDQNDREETKNIFEKVFTGESITKIKYIESNHTYWEIKCSPIADENKDIIGATIFSINISDRIKSEVALKKSEEKYRNIFENVQDIFFQTDINGIILELSPSVQQLMDYTKEELIGQSVNIAFYKINDGQTLMNLLKENGSVKDFEIILKTKKGFQKHISMDARIIYYSNGNPPHIDGFMRDISTRKSNELKISKQNIKLQIQNKELEQFAYITSHDLQEPLLTLKYFSELIKEEFPNVADKNLNQYLYFIIESSDRMQKLVKGLLDYSRVGNQIKIKKIDCNEIVNEAINSLTELIEEKDIEIKINQLPLLEGYSIELVQLFQHLITNSIKFRKKHIPLIITISAKLIKDNWQFSVQDNGIGIEKKNKEKVFIIFKRLNNREEYSGIGIGLAICKKIVELHGGNIWVESQIGQGCTINFTLPKNEKK
ncbi:MASE1 domain-containing protein [Flavobacterium sp. N3904]|uniref:MASE1 domain-containing protein n=1 Tax=Flavobacterium sp. N3904 TaxID=2986835 RepID=UPI0022257B2E|nr:MASE1 domain-containing protein [Flavobacterium sp. N3904]